VVNFGDQVWSASRIGVSVAEQGVDGSQPSVARAHGVATFLLQVVEEGADGGGVEVLEIDGLWGMAGV
jgi:hypothetical protein